MRSRVTQRAVEERAIAVLRAGGLSVAEQHKQVRKLKRIGTAASVEVLRGPVRSERINLAGDAVWALRRIGTDDAVDALIECLDLKPGTRLTLAAAALRKLRNRAAVPAIVRCLATRAHVLNAGTRRILMLALGDMPHVSEVPVLADGLRDPRYRNRNAAAWALAQIRAPESAAALEAVAREYSWIRGIPIRRGLRERLERSDAG
jgi:hypothetical protein